MMQNPLENITRFLLTINFREKKEKERDVYEFRTKVEFLRVRTCAGNNEFNYELI